MVWDLVCGALDVMLQIVRGEMDLKILWVFICHWVATTVTVI
jgi:hypothetical protein